MSQTVSFPLACFAPHPSDRCPQSQVRRASCLLSHILSFLARLGAKRTHHGTRSRASESVLDLGQRKEIQDRSRKKGGNEHFALPVFFFLSKPRLKWMRKQPKPYDAFILTLLFGPIDAKRCFQLLSKRTSGKLGLDWL